MMMVATVLSAATTYIIVESCFAGKQAQALVLVSFIMALLLAGLYQLPDNASLLQLLLD